MLAFFNKELAILRISVLDVQEIGTQNKKEKKTLTHSSLFLSFIRLVNDTGENRREYEKGKRWVFALSLSPFSFSLFLLIWEEEKEGKGFFFLFLFALFFFPHHMWEGQSRPISPPSLAVVLNCHCCRFVKNHQNTKICLNQLVFVHHDIYVFYHIW